MVSFHEEAITSNCREALLFLREQAFIKDFYLAGGTALALQIGHRISTDLDWFSTTQSLSEGFRRELTKTLSRGLDFEVSSEQDGLLFVRLLDTDVSFIHQHHPLMSPTVAYKNIQLASPTDIGLMKLAAINSRGTRRDFVDLYCLREIADLEQLFAMAARKYKDRPSFLVIAAKALAYFEDAEQQPMPRMLTPVDWGEIRAYCQKAARDLTRRISGLE